MRDLVGEYEIDENESIKIEMVDKGIMSPDRADSEAMQMATQAPILIPGTPLIVMGGTMETASYDGSIS